jgi:O-acetyl-ADP-ribose deacetylase
MRQVNAANNYLWMGAGVAGAIKRAGGQLIEDEAVRLGPIHPGEAVVTGAWSLRARYVIHAAAMGQDLVTNADLIRQATVTACGRLVASD